MAATRAPFFSMLSISRTYPSWLRTTSTTPLGAGCAVPYAAQLTTRRRCLTRCRRSLTPRLGPGDVHQVHDRPETLLHLLPGSCRDALLQEEAHRFSSKVAAQSFGEGFQYCLGEPFGRRFHLAEHLAYQEHRAGRLTK